MGLWSQVEGRMVDVWLSRNVMVIYVQNMLRVWGLGFSDWGLD
jgi:hypothetical protein